MDKSLTPVIKELATAVSVSNTHTINIGKLLDFSLKCLLVGITVLFATNVAFADKPSDNIFKEEWYGNSGKSKDTRTKSQKELDRKIEKAIIKGVTVGIATGGNPSAIVITVVADILDILDEHGRSKAEAKQRRLEIERKIKDEVRRQISINEERTKK